MEGSRQELDDWKNSNEEVSFTDPVTSYYLSIRFHGQINDPMGQYILSVNGVKFDDMTEYKEEEPVRMARQTTINDWKSKNKWTIWPMVFRGVSGTAMARHNPTSRQTRLAYGAEEVVVNDKDLTDDSLWPIVLIFEESDVSVKLELLKPTGQQFILNVNGRGYECLTFRALYTSSDH